jgi:predicted RNase H-like HicB family nuclease
MKLTAIIEAEGNGCESLCPELDIASQGDSIEEACNNLQEALELFFETASRDEIKQRLPGEVCVTQLEVAAGLATIPFRQGSLRHIEQAWLRRI